MNLRIALYFAISLIFISCKENSVEPLELQHKEVIIFTSNRTSANRNLFRMDLDGSNLKQLTFFGEGNYVASDISKDGKKILIYNSWSGEPDVGMEIYIYLVTEFKVIGPIAYGTPGNFSPDQKKFVYTKHIWSEGIDSIWIYNLEDGTEKRLTGTTTSCCQCNYSSDGKFIVYGEMDPKSPNYTSICLMDTTGKEIKKLTANKNGNFALYPRFLNKENKVLFTFLSAEYQSWYDICMAEISSTNIKIISNVHQRTQYDNAIIFNHVTTNSNDTKIIFNTNRGYEQKLLYPEIGIMNIDGTGHIRLTNDKYWDSNPIVGKLYFY